MENIETISLSDIAVIIDPCYNMGDLGCGAVLEGILPGTWVCGVDYHEYWEGKPGRVESLYGYHIDEPDIDFSLDKLEWVACCGVDSGQLGIFDDAYFARSLEIDPRRKGDWYNEVCEVTLTDLRAGAKDERCYVSSSGEGDGSYAVYIARNGAGQIIGIHIPFLRPAKKSDQHAEEEEEDSFDVDDYWSPEDDA